MGRVTLENAGEVVRYHRPTEEQVAKHEELAAAAEACIRAVLGPGGHYAEGFHQTFDVFFDAIDRCPPGWDRTHATGTAYEAYELAEQAFTESARQSAIATIRLAKMWASASVALDGMI